MIMKEIKPEQEQISIDQQDLQQYGEELLIEKIKNIFDEVAKDKSDYEESYQSQAYRRQPAKPQRTEQLNTSVQVLEQSQQDFPRIDRRAYIQETRQTQDQIPQPNQQAPQPYIVPIVINQQNTSAQPNGGLNPNQLRDIISQAISAQLSMHNIRKDKEQELQDPLNQTTRTLEEEEAKTKLEQQLLRKQIPINVHPYISQTINQGPSKSYQNPFFMSGVGPQTGNIYGIQPPLINDLDQFNLESETSSDFLSMESSTYSGKDFFKSTKQRHRQTRYSNLSQDERSEGEVGREESDGDISIGEIKIPSQETSQKPKLIQSHLAQTINYEEDKIPEEGVEKPIYESSEGPIPKTKGRRPGNIGRGGTGKSGNANILLSGESFGVNPLRSIKGKPESKTFNKREKIDDNFLEEEDDYQSSKMSESGEIDPKLFA